ncbi:MAG: autoinducer binding domain-containing protein [Pseudomonadota bacterium]
MVLSVEDVGADEADLSVRGRIDLQTARLARIAPLGFFYALHIRFALPLLHHQTYPTGWTDRYTEQAYALRDPVIAWGFSEEGTRRWSEIDHVDPLNILGQAAAYGMIFGLAVSIGPMSSRTIASAARDDREFTSSEIAAFAALVHDLHANTEPPTTLTPAQAEALRCVAEGDRHAAAAAKLNISESAFKARLASARNSLFARTTAEAIQRAKDYRLI